MSESTCRRIEVGATMDARTTSSSGSARPEASGGQGERRWLDRSRLFAVLSAVLLVGLAVVLPAGAAGARSGSGVLPPSATPYGYSRADMTGLLAAFTASGNNPSYYPATPFQVLYVAPDQFDVTAVTRHHDPCELGTPGCGLFATQKDRYANTFHVSRRTTFFVPVDNADDSPVVVGDYPTTLRGAKAYVFSRDQLGGKGFVICIDSKSVAIGPEYVAGPSRRLRCPTAVGRT